MLVTFGISVGAWKWCVYVTPDTKDEKTIVNQGCIKYFSAFTNNDSKTYAFREQNG